jgi:hypothetical protein
MGRHQPLGRAAGDWVDLFVGAGVRADELIGPGGTRSKSIKIGQFFTPLVGREVPIEVKGRRGTAVLRAEMGRAKEKRYYFEVRWEQPADAGKGQPRAPGARQEKPKRNRAAPRADSSKPAKGKGSRGDRKRANSTKGRPAMKRGAEAGGNGNREPW